MASQADKSHIFDRDLLKIRRERAKRRRGRFLLERAAKDVADRLLDIQREFDKILILGMPECWDIIRAELPQTHWPKMSVTGFDLSDIDELNWIFKESDMPTDYKPFDVILSLLTLQSVNELPQYLQQIRRALNPDGLFIGSMIGGDSLKELRQACYAADEQILGGFSPRIFPFVTHSQCGQLLQQAGLALPVVDIDRFSVKYSNLGRLIDDIRDIGETNCLRDRNKAYVGRQYWDIVKSVYREPGSTPDHKFITRFEILWLTGWSPHHSQPQPLKPGSAEISLKDVLTPKARL